MFRIDLESEATRATSLKWLLAILLVTACSVPLSAAAQSGEAKQIDIPAGSLTDALDALARQSGAEFIYRADQLRGLQTQGARGTLSPEAALNRLLEDSGFTTRKDSSGAILIIRQEKEAASPKQFDDVEKESPEEVSAEVETIVVTGTHIRNIAPTGSPVTVIDAESIRGSGYSGTEQLLQALPQNFRGGEAGASADVNFSVGSQRGFNMTSGSGVNLRGLGAKATLVLINGRRIAPSSGGTFTDISMIPLDAIERIEILADGASAVYGADAVGGVVNIILKSNYDSAETRLSFGATTESGRDEYRLSHNMGRHWNTGNIMLSADYLQQSQLLSSEREFTAGVPDPTSVFPSNKLTSLALSGSQAITDALILKGDVQYSHAERFSVVTESSGRRSESLTKPVRRSAALTLDYQLDNDWIVELDLFTSEEKARSRQHSFTPDGALQFDSLHVRTQEQMGAELKGSGRLFDLPGGIVRLATGIVYKEENYRRTIDLWGIDQGASRDNSSAFAELYIPLFSDSNARPGLRRLDLSLAARYDDYSDIGSSTNPRIGLSWSPTRNLTLRTSYSTSFRAPAIGEESRFNADGLLGGTLQPFPSADGSGFVPVVTWLGSEELRPEKSRNRSIGIDWSPRFAPETSLSLTYYSIKYTDRIILPPLDFGLLGNPELQAFVRHYDSPEQLRAVVDDAIARGLPFFDFTDGMFGSDPLSIATVAFNYLWTNAQRVDTSGYDVGIHHRFGWNEHEFDAGLEASYIEQNETRLSPTATPFDVVGTFGNPPKLRARGSLTWTYGRITSALNINYSHSYTDTSGLVDRPAGSYTTADLTSRYTFSPSDNSITNGLSLSIMVINLLDRQPPFVHAGGRGSHYDPANASPLGRMVSMQLAKRW